MTYIAKTRSNGDTSESRGHVARYLLQDAKRIRAKVLMQEDSDEVGRQASQFAGTELQDFIIEIFLVRSKNWEEVVAELEKHVAKEEEREKRECQRNRSDDDHDEGNYKRDA
ncbi:hypothetical protein NGRA_1985 [Nosema granulosis]|uniref:Uncharacterized protein n=1 Tax=Nosema granulosis TaxID=83296 RepID=A0A9P6GXI6_9MICR|nr:hypothetical protein NGRA_1985 [Nosema granulosis]